MHMSVRHFKADDANAASFAVECFFDGVRYRLGKYQHLRKITIGHIEYFIDLNFWYHQYMTGNQRFNIKKSKELIALCNFE